MKIHMLRTTLAMFPNRQDQPSKREDAKRVKRMRDARKKRRDAAQKKAK